MPEQPHPSLEDTKHLLTSIFQHYPDVVNVPQLCEMLGGISSKSAYKLLQANRIPHFKIGRAYKIPKIQVIAYLQSLMHSQQLHHENNFNTLTRLTTVFTMI
ncbi:helix-turn-helix domain-containing protein [Paenibacillus sp. S150]|uniref:helix-turn-helix domain-containing protein n=1 Tax=Paenibacillus sp. S150 TaxID=2749826 RepID=UPI001C61B9F0|nr:helix-turn-helix domain-containing protein [Paenibacillus sp. S150]MBW4085708.1 helix-turn-helix domain-containing protein [Paenibacillus sp. S150]